MAEEKKQNNSESGNKRKGKRRYFRRRRRKDDKNAGPSSQQDSAGAEAKGDDESAQKGGGSANKRRRKKRRSNRRRSSRRQRQEQPDPMPKAADVPEDPNYVPPTDVYIYTHIIRPAYRDVGGDYIPEHSFKYGQHSVDDPPGMDRLKEEINEQLADQFDSPPSNIADKGEH